MAVVINEHRMSEWPKKFMAELKQHPEAPESLGSLEGEGVRRKVLLDFLYSYTNPESVKAQRALRDWAGAVATLLAKTEKWMRQSADTVAASLDEIHMRFPMSAQTGGEEATIRSLRTAIDDVANLRERYKHLSSQKGKARNEDELVYLCLLVQSITGRPHWEDLAYLLVVAFATWGSHEDWDEDAVRKVVARYSKSYPKAYRSTRDFLMEYMQTSPKPSPITRTTKSRRPAKSKPYAPTTYVDRSPKRRT